MPLILKDTSNAISPIRVLQIKAYNLCKVGSLCNYVSLSNVEGDVDEIVKKAIGLSKQNNNNFALA